MKSNLNITNRNINRVLNKILIYLIKYVNFKDNLQSRQIKIHKH
jgi:hypothetical protein